MKELVGKNITLHYKDGRVRKGLLVDCIKFQGNNYLTLELEKGLWFDVAKFNISKVSYYEGDQKVEVLI